MLPGAWAYTLPRARPLQVRRLKIAQVSEKCTHSVAEEQGSLWVFSRSDWANSCWERGAGVSPGFGAAMPTAMSVPSRSADGESAKAGQFSIPGSSLCQGACGPQCQRIAQQERTAGFFRKRPIARSTQAGIGGCSGASLAKSADSQEHGRTSGIISFRGNLNGRIAGHEFDARQAWSDCWAGHSHDSGGAARLGDAPEVVQKMGRCFAPRQPGAGIISRRLRDAPAPFF